MEEPENSARLNEFYEMNKVMQGINCFFTLDSQTIAGRAAIKDGADNFSDPTFDLGPFFEGNASKESEEEFASEKANDVCFQRENCMNSSSQQLPIPSMNNPTTERCYSTSGLESNYNQQSDF